MASYTPAYRATIYASRRVDPTEATVLTPAVGAPHSDPFQVATVSGLAGYQPYLLLPSGRRGALDCLEKTLQTSELVLEVLDSRLATSDNKTRWAAAFFGNAGGDDQFLGCLVQVQESLDGGMTFTDYFTGRISDVEAADHRNVVRFTVRDLGEDFSLIDIFVSHRPHASITYAASHWGVPLGLTSPYGPVPATPPLTGTIATLAGSGLYQQLLVDSASINNIANIVTAGLLKATGTWQVLGGGSAVFVDPRYRLRITTTGDGITAEYLPVFTFVTSRADKHFAISKFYFMPLLGPGGWASGDPYFRTYLSPGAAVTWSLVPYFASAPSTDDPLFLTDVHPVQLWKDILDGKFSRLWSTQDVLPAGKNPGDVRVTFPYDATAFATLIADTTIPTGRFVITASAALNDWVENAICKPYNLGYRLDGSGQVVPIDLRPLSVVSGSPATITADDLDAAGAAPAWKRDRRGAVTRMTGKYYLDTVVAPSDVLQASDQFPSVPMGLVTSTEYDLVIPSFDRWDLGDQEFEVDGVGYRAFAQNDPAGPTSRAVYVQQSLQGALEGLKGRYGSGPYTLVITCRRTANTDCQQGDLRFIAIDELPDPYTNKRGGTRLMRCVQRVDQGLTRELSFLDEGPNSIAAAPSLGVPAKDTNDPAASSTCAVTLNAAGDPAEVQVNVTATSVGSHPGDTDPGWTHVVLARGSATIAARHLSAGMRVWWRTRSQPANVGSGRLSPWAYAAAPGYADLDALPAPSGLAVGSPQATSALATWTNADTTHDVEVWLATPAGGTAVLVARLDPGAAQFPLAGLTPSTSYTVKVRLVDGQGGASSFASVDFTTATTAPTAASLEGIGFVGADATGLAPTIATVSGLALLARRPQPFGTAIQLVPGDLSLQVGLYRSDDGGVTYNRIALLDPLPESGFVVTDRLPSDGVVRYYKARHEGTNVQSGPFTAVISHAPYALPSEVPQQPLAVNTIYPMRRDKPLTDGGFATLADSSDGKQLNRANKLAGQGRTLAALASTPELVVNAEFDIWESASQPHAWTVDTGDGSSAAQTSAAGEVFSGDYAGKFSFGAGGSAGTYRGFTTNDPTKGAWCVPLRPGRTYRLLVASRVSAIGAGESYRLTLTHNAGGTLVSQKVFAYAAANAYQVDEFDVSVPAAADPNTKLAIEFTRGNTTAHTFWVDSLRVVEDMPNAAMLAAQLAQAGGDFVQNGGAESGCAYWRLENGSALDTTTASPIEGSRSFAITIPASPALQRAQQCDRASDLANSAGGSPLYVPVQPYDEVYGSMGIAGPITDASATYGFGIEEYDAAKSLIQRTYLKQQTVVGSATLRGGAVLSGTTRYVVPFFEIQPSAGGGAIGPYKFDALHLYRVPAKRRVLLHNSTNQSLTNITEAALSWDTEDEDVGALHSTVTNPTRVTVAAEMLGYGSLVLEAQCQFASNATGYRRLKIRKNSTTIIAEREVGAVNGDPTTVGITCEVPLAGAASTDYYEVLAYQNSGGALNAVAGAGVTWCRVRHAF